MDLCPPNPLRLELPPCERSVRSSSVRASSTRNGCDPRARGPGRALNSNQLIIERAACRYPGPGYRAWLRTEEDRMNSKKQKAKDRRRARALAERAWDAANQDNLDLAEKLIRRAVSTQEDNPVLWNDQGAILGLRHKDSEAARSFAAALSLAPTFADPYACLAALRLRQGLVEEALGLQAQAVKYAPQNAPYAEQLRAYQALAGQLPPHAESPAVATVAPTEVSPADPYNDWPQRLGALDWHAL